MAKIRLWPNLNPLRVCKMCGGKNLKRNEKLYRFVFIILVAVTPLIVPLMAYKRIPNWLNFVPDQVLFTSGWLFIISFTILLIYNIYDRKHSFKCTACGAQEIIKTDPFTAIEKIFIWIFAVGFLVFFTLITAMVWTALV